MPLTLTLNLYLLFFFFNLVIPTFIKFFSNVSVAFLIDKTLNLQTLFKQKTYCSNYKKFENF